LRSLSRSVAIAVAAVIVPFVDDGAEQAQIERVDAVRRIGSEPSHGLDPPELTKDSHVEA
jgi:hypothetical protein